MKLAKILWLLLPLATLAFAQGGKASISDSVNEKLMVVVDLLRSIAPGVAIAIFVFAGVVYAGGQAFDAQTRTKAQNYSMSLITGAVVGILLVVLAPFLVDLLLGVGG